MSHFVVYALTRNVGIDIVPPVPLRRLQSRHSRRDIPLSLSPSEFLISRNSYKPSCYRAGEPSAYYFGNGIFRPAREAHVERKIARPHPVPFYLRLILSQIRLGGVTFIIF